ncbi:MAG: hypothetical protein WBA06_01105, partial [Candidatus Aquilonibacter sp.]
MKTRLFAVALVPLLAIALLSGYLLHGQKAGAQQQVSLNDMSQNPNQWVMPAGDFANLRHSDLTQITTDNVKNMHVAWMMSTGATRGHEGQPLVIGDTLYFESAYPNHVYAVSLDDYHIKWEYTPTQDSFATSVACCDLVNRGVG